MGQEGRLEEEGSMDTNQPFDSQLSQHPRFPMQRGMPRGRGPRGNFQQPRGVGMPSQRFPGPDGGMGMRGGRGQGPPRGGGFMRGQGQRGDAPQAEGNYPPNQSFQSGPESSRGRGQAHGRGVKMRGSGRGMGFLPGHQAGALSGTDEDQERSDFQDGDNMPEEQVGER